MFICFCWVKICALGFSEFLENIFSLLLVVEAFFLHKVVRMLEAVAIIWQDVRWIWWMRQSVIAQTVQLLKLWLCQVQSGVVVEKNWAHFVDQCRLQALQCLVHLIDLLSILLRCSGFARMQKAVLDQTISRSPNSDNDFFWCKFDFRKCFELLLSPTTQLVITVCL